MRVGLAGDLDAGALKLLRGGFGPDALFDPGGNYLARQPGHSGEITSPLPPQTQGLPPVKYGDGSMAKQKG
jgi:hypothetical protein